MPARRFESLPLWGPIRNGGMDDRCTIPRERGWEGFEIAARSHPGGIDDAVCTCNPDAH